MRKFAAGFTLIETMLAIVLIGLMSILIMPAAEMAAGVSEQANRENQRAINSKIANGLLAFAKTTAGGTLPTPFTSGAVAKNFVADLSSTALVNQLLLSGVDYRMINDDGFASKRVRVYQLVSGLTQSTPIYFQSGPSVTLTYQFGAVYSTECLISTACFTGSSLPGSSAPMTSANYGTWAPSGTDNSPVYLSTLPLQKQMLELTVKRMDRVRDSLISNFTARSLLATPSDTTNWYPMAAASLAGQVPGTNQGCRDGWYDLSSANVLTQLGLAPSEFGVTAWGGVIEYCRDYDPTGASGANTIPHYAALRILRDVSGGLSPDPTILANNLLISI